MRTGPRTWGAVLTLAVLAAAPSLRAAPEPAGTPPAAPAVRDALGLFPEGERERAEARIAEMRRSTGQGLVVETLPRLPDEVHRKLLALNRRGQNALLQRTAEERARAAGVAGVYVLLVRDPGRVQVVSWPPEEDLVLSDAARFRLYQVFTSRDFDRDPGAGLLRAVDLARGEVAAAARARQAPPAERGSLPWAGLLILLGVLLGLWGVLTWRRSRAAGGPAAGDAGAGAMGHLVGQSGEWLVSRLTGGSEPAAAPPPERPELAPSPPAVPDPHRPEEKDLWRPHDHP